MKESVVVEIAPFTVADGVTDERLIAASEELQSEFLAQQNGFIRRELLRGNDGEWMDLVVWQDRTSAKAAIERAAESPVCFRFFELMAQNGNGAGDGVKLLERIKVYEGR